MKQTPVTFSTDLYRVFTTEGGETRSIPVYQSLMGYMRTRNAKLVDLAMGALKDEGINKVLLVAFKKNAGGNAFWESQGFTLREDLNYRNKALTELIRMDPDYTRD